MRKLTKKQKEILFQHVASVKHINGHMPTIEDMDTSLYNDLQEENDYETMYQDANRYLSDVWFAWKLRGTLAML